MLSQSERDRKRDILYRLFEPRTAEERNQRTNREATADEVRKFLELSGRNHRKYFHYTCLDALCGMLRSGQMWLTRADRLNDLKEYGCSKDRASCYVASFGTSALENVAMWWMYGLGGNIDNTARIPVRLEFDGRAFQHCVSRLAPVVSNHGSAKASLVSVDTNGNTVPNVQNVILHDMLYQRSNSRISEKTGKRRHGAVSWNGMVADDIRCRAFECAADSLPGFVKGFGWSFENETRITVRLSRKGHHPDRIAMPFEEALQSVRIVIGPTADAERIRENVLKTILNAPKIPALLSVIDWRDRIKSSSYQVHFSK